MGFIPLVIASIGQHKLAMDVVKSACHTLAILSDVKGQASSIAFAGIILVLSALSHLFDYIIHLPFLVTTALYPECRGGQYSLSTDPGP